MVEKFPIVLEKLPQVLRGNFFKLTLYTYLVTYLLTYIVGSVRKTGNNSETVEDRAKVTINGLYKVVHGLSIAAKMYYLE